MLPVGSSGLSCRCSPPSLDNSRHAWNALVQFQKATVSTMFFTAGSGTPCSARPRPLPCFITFGIVELWVNPRFTSSSALSQEAKKETTYSLKDGLKTPSLLSFHSSMFNRSQRPGLEAPKQPQVQGQVWGRRRKSSAETNPQRKTARQTDHAR